MQQQCLQTDTVAALCVLKNCLPIPSELSVILQAKDRYDHLPCPWKFTIWTPQEQFLMSLHTYHGRVRIPSPAKSEIRRYELA